MRLSFFFNSKRMIFGSLGSLFLILALLWFPNLMAASLDPEQAQEEIRNFMKKERTNQHLKDLKETGLSSSDTDMANRLVEGLQRIDRITFESVEIGSFLFVPPFTSNKLFIVKAVMRDGQGQERTRYFSLSARNKFFDFFWVNEQSAWMWVLSL